MRKVALALVVRNEQQSRPLRLLPARIRSIRARLTQARKIKAEITARYVEGSPKLVVTEASPTGVIESFLLLSADFLELRVVPADNGIHYAICPVRATCPYPGPRCGPTGERIRPSPAGARARAANVPRDVGDGRLGLASHARVRLLPRRARRASGSRHGCAGEGAGRQSCAFACRLAATHGRRDHTPQAVRAARPRADPERTSSLSVRCRSGPQAALSRSSAVAARACVVERWEQ